MSNCQSHTSHPSFSSYSTRSAAFLVIHNLFTLKLPHGGRTKLTVIESDSKMYMTLMTMYSSVCICNNFRAVLAPIDLQLFDFVYKPVRAVILLSPICGKLEELRQREQVKINGSSSLSIVLCSRSSSRPCASLALLNLIIARLDQQRVRQDWHLDKSKTAIVSRVI